MINKVILIGNVGADPEVRQTSGGTSVCELSLATSESYKDKDGNRATKTEWHRVIVWGTTADNVGRFVKKGSKLYVEGKLQTRSWDDKEGNKRYTTEIIASQVTFLDSKSSSDGAPRTDTPSKSSGGSFSSGGFDDTDIPF